MGGGEGRGGKEQGRGGDGNHVERAVSANAGGGHSPTPLLSPLPGPTFLLSYGASRGRSEMFMLACTTCMWDKNRQDSEECEMCGARFTPQAAANPPPPPGVEADDVVAIVEEEEEEERAPVPNIASQSPAAAEAGPAGGAAALDTCFVCKTKDTGDGWRFCAICVRNHPQAREGVRKACELYDKAVCIGEQRRELDLSSRQKRLRSQGEGTHLGILNASDLLHDELYAAAVRLGLFTCRPCSAKRLRKSTWVDGRGLPFWRCTDCAGM